MDLPCTHPQENQAAFQPTCCWTRDSDSHKRDDTHDAPTCALRQVFLQVCNHGSSETGAPQPQTFIISPLLLPKLPYAGDVKVHTIFNGPQLAANPDGESAIDWHYCHTDTYISGAYMLSDFKHYVVAKVQKRKRNMQKTPPKNCRTKLWLHDFQSRALRETVTRWKCRTDHHYTWDVEYIRNPNTIRCKIFKYAFGKWSFT